MIIDPQSVAGQTSSQYPEPFRSRLVGRTRQRLGAVAGLQNFGINWVTLAPGGQSALRHWHEKQDEFIYVVQGHLTLIDESGEHSLTVGMMAAFPAGVAAGHHLVNRSDAPAVYLEIGDRTPNDVVHYPDDDLVAEGDAAGWRFAHKDGRPYA